MPKTDENMCVCNEPSTAGEIAENRGRGREEVPEFVPIKHELYVLVKHWYTVAIKNESDSDAHADAIACCVDIERYLGVAVTASAVVEAMAEADAT